MITWKRFFYISIIVLVAGSSALVGALAGGLAVYTAVRNRLQTAPAAITAPSSSFTSASTPASTPASTIQIETAGVETKIIDAVTQVGPAVVTVVGTIPDQMTFFGPTGDQTVSGSGVFISPEGYLLTNNHVVEGVKQVSIILSDGSQQQAPIVGADPYADLAVLKTDGQPPAVAV